MGSSKKIMQGIAKKLKYQQGFVAKKLIQQTSSMFFPQNKVSSLSYAREFYDPESGSSSGATHVPDQASVIPSPRTTPRCDSGLLHDTRNFTGASGNVFERPPAQEGRPSTFFNNSMNLHLQHLIFQRQQGKK